MSAATSAGLASYRAGVEALAAEHGHDLAPWWSSAAIGAATRCETCLASAGARPDGSPLPSSTIARPCRARAGRYYPAKFGRWWYVLDREQPGGEPVAGLLAKGPATTRARALNAEAGAPVPAATPEGELAQLVAAAERRRARAASALARAEQALADLYVRAGATPATLRTVSITNTGGTNMPTTTTKTTATARKSRARAKAAAAAPPPAKTPRAAKPAPAPAEGAARPPRAGSTLAAIVDVLMRADEPMHHRLITDAIIGGNLAPGLQGATPGDTVKAACAVAAKRGLHGIISTAPGTYAIPNAEVSEPEKRHAARTRKAGKPAARKPAARKAASTPARKPAGRKAAKVARS